MGFADWLTTAPSGPAAATAAIAATGRNAVEPASVAAVAGIAVAGIAVASLGPKATRWALHFAEAEVGVLVCDPPIALADVLEKYPTALAAEPLPAPVPEELPRAVAVMVAECVAVELYGDDEVPLIRAMHAADPQGTRALVRAMHSRIGGCYRCKHFSRPGLSSGYCGGRDDLEPVYGPRHPLREVPADEGANCSEWVER
jgi:hypothetical protein